MICMLELNKKIINSQIKGGGNENIRMACLQEKN